MASPGGWGDVLAAPRRFVGRGVALQGSPQASCRRRSRPGRASYVCVAFTCVLVVAELWPAPTRRESQRAVAVPAATTPAADPAPRAVSQRTFELPRRRGVLQLTSAGLVGGAAPALAGESPKLLTSWSAKEGNGYFLEYEEPLYKAMRDDARRTPLFIKAIQERLAGQEGKLAVLDIGTGPFAVFALAAARAGARKVYAVEGNTEAAARAQEAVEKAEESGDVPKGVVEVFEGFSTTLNFPEKVDLVCAELAGAIASEENVLTTLRDARARLVKEPDNPRSYIPVEVQTLGAPACYALHAMFAPPRYEKLNGRPLRLDCRDTTLQLLAEPKVVEAIRFPDPKFLQAGKPLQSTASFSFSASRINTSQKMFYDTLVKADATAEDALTASTSVANSFSGMAFWSRQVLDPAGSIVVEARGPQGDAMPSYWKTVLALMSPQPVPVKPGDEFRFEDVAEFDSADVLEPARYSLKGFVIPGRAIAA